MRDLPLDERQKLQARAKIRVLYPDGVFRGGILKLWTLDRIRDRVWEIRGSEHRDMLWYTSRGTWFRILLANDPDLEGPDDGSDPFDAASYAYRLDDNAARHWFVANRMGIPALLDANGPELSSSRREILAAMLELDAVGSDSRARRSVIAKKARGQPEPDLIKDDLAWLRRSGFTDSKKGRYGGCWLLPPGIDAARAIGESS